MYTRIMKLRHPIHARSILCAFICITLSGGIVKAVAHQSSPLGQTITVPLDYMNPKLGKGSLYFEFGAPYDKNKPVVFIIADAQQYYVRRGAVANLQKTLFGDTLNVVGIIGRGSSQEFIKAALYADGQPNWLQAWRIFNSEQWIDDIDAVRRSVVGDAGKILLYGRSGGAFLVHQYLAKYGNHAQRAFTQAALNPFIVNELGLNSDHFWDEIGAQDKSLQPMLRKVLEQRAADRATIIATLQRQNFFVPQDKLATARADLIRSLAAGNTRHYDEAREEYQVDDIEKINASAEGLGIRVRLFEFFYPSGARTKLGGEAIYPDLENQHNVAQPLISLCDAGKISAPSFDFVRLHQLNTEVFILAARWDHTVDYRSSIALAANYPQRHLFLADDNHTFEKLNRNGDNTRILRAFLSYGLRSAQLRDARNAAELVRWTER